MFNLLGAVVQAFVTSIDHDKLMYSLITIWTLYTSLSIYSNTTPIYDEFHCLNWQIDRSTSEI